MKGYIIKETYTDGEFKGLTYFLTKGGYIAQEDWEWSYRAYKTRKMAERRCKQLFAENELNRQVYPDIYAPMSYEPWEVEVID